MSGNNASIKCTETVQILSTTKADQQRSCLNNHFASIETAKKKSPGSLTVGRLSWWGFMIAAANIFILKIQKHSPSLVVIVLILLLSLLPLS